MPGTQRRLNGRSANPEGSIHRPWPPADPISSRANPLVKHLRALTQRKGRDESASFLAEGILPVWRAVENGSRILTLVVAADLLRSDRARHMVAEQADRGVPVAMLSTDLFCSVVERDHPSGLAALIAMSPVLLTDLVIQPDSVFSVFHTPSNPGNLGACLRSIDATGGSGAIITGGGTDVYHPTAVKASMGTLFTLPVIAQVAWPAVREWCGSNGLSLVATSSHASADLWHAPLPRPLAVVFGNEGEGLPDEVIRGCDLTTTIPMAHGGSLNMAVAAAVLLFELRRRSVAGHEHTSQAI